MSKYIVNKKEPKNESLTIDLKPQSDPQHLKDIKQLIKYSDLPNKILFLTAFICALASSILYPSVFWIYGNVIKIIIDYNNYESKLNDNKTNTTIQCPDRTKNFTGPIDLVGSVSTYIYLYVYFAIGIFATHFLAYFLWDIATERHTINLRSLLYKSIIRQEVSWFDTFKLGDCNILFGLIDKVKLGYGTKFIDFVILITRAITAFIFGFYSCWKLALALTAVMPISIVFFVITIVIMKKYTVAENKAHSSVMSLGEEVLTAIKVVIAYGGQKQEIKNFDSLLNSVKKIAIKKGFIVGITSGFAGFFNSMSYAVLIGFGTYVFQTDCSFNSGNIIQTFAALIIATLAVSQALPFVKEFSEGRLSCNKLFDIIEKKSAADVFDESGSILNNSERNFDLDFSNLYFHYPSNKEKKVINNLNIKIPFGTTVGICGPSGCGKSTLTRLLTRIYEPTDGRILFSNKDIKTFNLKWWRSQISIVSQDSAFFTISIKDNIKLARPDATDEDIIEASKAANAHEFIMRFTEGYDTIIGRNGKELSGGEKQRISIARAFLRNSKILILDEATSALDNETENLIQESLQKLKAGKTTIVIAHRLSTIKDVDMIIQMEDGEITDVGRHEELLERKGYYYHLLHVDDNVKKSEVAKTPNVINKPVDNEMNDEDETSIELKVVSAAGPAKNNELKNPQLKVWILSKPEWFWIFISGLASFLQGSIYPLIAFCFCQLVEILALNEMAEQTRISLIFTGVILSLAVLSFFIQFSQSFATTKSGAELTTRIKSMLFKSMISKDFIYFSSPLHRPNVLMSKLSTKAPLLKGYTSERVGIILNFISSVGLPVSMSIAFSWKLGLVISLFMPVALIWGFMQGQFLRGNQKLSGASKLKEAISIASETVNNVYTVTLFNLQEHFYLKLDRLFKHSFNRIIVVLLIEAFFYALGYTLYFLVQAASYSYGSVLLKNGEIDAKYIVFIFLSILFSSMYLGKNISSLPDVPKAKKATEWVFNIMYADEPIIESDSREGVVIDDFKGNIHFSNVQFKYPNSDVEILKGVSLKFNHGKSNALVGNSGGGKSTILSLIHRYYDSTNGFITVDGVELKKLNIKWLRTKIGIVFQEPILLNRSIKDNIAYGLEQENVTTEMIIEASKQAAIHEKIMQLPQTYDTIITANMMNLSGGEKQRISIARALIRNPKILLLDEATSALDNNAQHEIQKTLDNAAENRTSITIAHRLSTIQNSFKIFVIKNGEVVEEGNHESLINNKGFYYDLHHSQDH